VAPANPALQDTHNGGSSSNISSSCTDDRLYCSGAIRVRLNDKLRKPYVAYAPTPSSFSSRTNIHGNSQQLNLKFSRRCDHCILKVWDALQISSKVPGFRSTVLPPSSGHREIILPGQKQQCHPKRWYVSSELHWVTSQKKVSFTTSDRQFKLAHYTCVNCTGQ
jgi:hypothetical protein